MTVEVHKAANPGRTVKVTVKRQDSPKEGGRWESFRVPVEPGMNVISCLQWIAANPKTIDGQLTTPVAWDCNCLEEVCGACTMVINGKVRQSCSCLIDEHAPSDGDEIVLEPMSKFPVVRDLQVDRSRFFKDLIKVKAWVPVDGTWDLGPGPKESQESQEFRYSLSTCMTCGCCLEACPQYTINNTFVGAAPLGQVQLFNMHGTGAALKGDRLDALMGAGGVNDCGNAQNCVKVCPRGVPLTEAIAAVGRAVTVHAVRQFFSGKG